NLFDAHQTSFNRPTHQTTSPCPPSSSKACYPLCSPIDGLGGTYRIIGTLANSGTHTFVTPDANSKDASDWVLVLEMVEGSP
ncbi:MAG: putative collagen-binding domain-containing protein, partial [Terriglobia bacterium]